MNSKKHIIYYLCLQATRQGQASYSHVHEIIKGLKKRGNAVTLFEPNYAKLQFVPGTFGRLKAFLVTQLRLICAPRCQVLYIRSHVAAFLVSWWAKFLGIPTIQEVNGPYEDLFLAWPWTRKFSRLIMYMFKRQYTWADSVIAVTPELVDWVKRESGNQNVYMVSNGANTDLFRPGIELSKNFSVPKKYAFFFGALATWQGIPDMLEAVRCPTWPEDVGLVIVGDGVEATNVKNAASNEKKILYLGRQPQRILPGLIGNSIAALSPQAGERGRTGLFPIKFFESLACGVPVIVTDYPGMGDFVRNHDCGMVVPPNSPTAIAEAVHQLAKNKDAARKMGARGRKAVESDHSWDKRAEQTLDVLHSIVKKIDGTVA
jgi:glycosyltransferase involved in cell wall biosynthesis